MDAKYVRDSLGDTLTRACALVAQYQPDDPIEWLATYLRHDVHRQELKEIRMKEDKERETLVEQAIAEEAQRAKLEEEALRLAELRKPNDNQLNCQDYLKQLGHKTTKLKTKLKGKANPDQLAGIELVKHVTQELSQLQLSEEAKSEDEVAPANVQKLIRAGLLLCGYQRSAVDDWSKIRTILRKEYTLRRYSTYDLLTEATDTRLLLAIKEAEGVDFQGRALQKHALGPLAVRFHTLVKSAAMALKENIEPYFTETTFEEDGEEVLRPLWHYPVAEGILVTDGTEDSTPSNIVSHLCGRDSMALDPALTRDAMCVEMSWILKENSSTDVDASLIMFDAEGDVCDSVYHLIDKSKDGSMIHQGDDGSEDNGDLESFHFRLADADPNIHNIALVINVATDGEDLTDVMSCGVRFRALDSKPEEGVTMHVTTERITGNEILLALLQRASGDQWRLVSIGEVVQGAEREGEESLNFMNAAPLAQYYLKELGLLPENAEADATKKAFNPFKMVPGNSFEVPGLALESPMVIGMGWDVDDDIAMDLDCGLAVYAGDQRTDYCDFEKLETNDKACQHQGDNRDGEGDGDDEQIIVEFSKLDPTSDVLFLYAAVYEGGALKDCENVHIRMVTLREGKLKEVCRFSLDWLASIEEDTAVILAKISRTEAGGFEFKTIGTTAHGRTIEELEGKLIDHLK